MSKTLDALSDYTDADLLVVTRNDTTEVWTLKDFGPHKLAFGSEANDIKDRNWSQHMAALVKFDVSEHPTKQHLIIDGRLRSAVGDKRCCSLFFLVTRLDRKNADQANMSLGYTSVNVTVEVTHPWEKEGATTTKAKELLPQIPVMYNSRKIKAQTKLLCTHDLDLQKVTDAVAKKRAVELQKESYEAKKAKKESGEAKKGKHS